MTVRPLARVDAKLVVQQWNNGRCQITGAYQPAASDYSHRIAAGRRGRRTPSNGLYVWRLAHDAITDAQDLSRRTGWMVISEANPAEVPVLCICDDVQGWWWLDPFGDGRVVHATASEVNHSGLDPSLTLRAALIELADRTGWVAPGWGLPAPVRAKLQATP